MKKVSGLCCLAEAPSSSRSIAIPVFSGMIVELITLFLVRRLLWISGLQTTSRPPRRAAQCHRLGAEPMDSWENNKP
jgi:hypothetical protein